MRLGAGWLSPVAAPDDKRPIIIADVVVPRWSDKEQAFFPTRQSEYGWAAQQLEFWPRGDLLDVGAGFNPEVHVMSYIAANQGFNVIALDADARAAQMPAHVAVQRVLGDLTLLPFGDDTFDVWLCISVLEHMRESDKALALHEAFRVLHSGGLALLTTDHTPPEETTEWFKSAGFLTGPVQPLAGPMLSPPVSYIVAQRPL